MQRVYIHRFEEGGRRYAIDPESCFCFECDEISWDVLEYYPEASMNRIFHELGGRHDVKELNEVIGELEWLRATKSILALQNTEKYMKQFEVEKGLKRLSVRLPRDTAEPQPTRSSWFGRGQAQVPSNTARSLGRDAATLLISRSEKQQDLLLEFLEDGTVANPDLITELCAEALKMAALAEKRLTAAVRIDGVRLTSPPAGLEGHQVSVRMEFRDPANVAKHLDALLKTGLDALPRIVKALHPADADVGGRVIVRPGTPSYEGVVPALDQAGVKVMELDLDGAYKDHPDGVTEFFPALRQSAVYYAESLLKGRYFRLDPVAPLFHRIYEGTPLRRYDPAGTNELAVESDGSLYPSRYFMGQPEFRVGSVPEGSLDGPAVRQFDDVGTLTTAACMRCWARHLCGGGCAAVHHALTGSPRTPAEVWCDAQRAWMQAAVAAFNLLSTEGVNFTRMYQHLGAGQKSSYSLLTMAKAALSMTVSMRPIEEADSPMLVKWENWNDAGYFALQPGGILLATTYEREMDALHPQGMEQEMILTKRDGTAIGLLRIGPDRLPDVAQAAIYLHDPAHYEAEDIRKGLRLVLGEAGKQQGLRRVVTHAPDRDAPLHALLTALGFQKAGTQREALFLHGRYHDVSVYALDLR